MRVLAAITASALFLLGMIMIFQNHYEASGLFWIAAILEGREVNG